MSKRRIGIVGYGSLGKHLIEQVEKSQDMEIDFVWNRSKEKLSHFPASMVLDDLRHVVNRNVNLIVEVADPSITAEYAQLFLQTADYLIGSPTALADDEIFSLVRKTALDNSRTVYVPSGAFWGAEDVKRMADNGNLTGLTVTMKKHPSAFRLESPLKEMNESFSENSIILYEGPLRKLCTLAPNNVNTMAVACIAGHNLGFDRVVGRLISDKSLTDWHVVEAEVKGENGFVVNLTRKNPSKFGAVSGAATYNSFWSSLKNACGKLPGVQMS